jgi:hypothetical protein
MYFFNFVRSEHVTLGAAIVLASHHLNMMLGRKRKGTASSPSREPESAAH